MLVTPKPRPHDWHPPLLQRMTDLVLLFMLVMSALKAYIAMNWPGSENFSFLVFNDKYKTAQNLNAYKCSTNFCDLVKNKNAFQSDAYCPQRLHLDRYPLDRDPPPDRDPLDRDPPEIPPGQRLPWTETPLDRDPPKQRPPRQRPP